MSKASSIASVRADYTNSQRELRKLYLHLNIYSVSIIFFSIDCPNPRKKKWKIFGLAAKLYVTDFKTLTIQPAVVTSRTQNSVHFGWLNLTRIKKKAKFKCCVLVKYRIKMDLRIRNNIILFNSQRCVFECNAHNTRVSWFRFNVYMLYVDLVIFVYLKNP